VIGRSGSGKTNIAMTLMRYYDGVVGQIAIRDTEVTKLSVKAIRHNIAYISRDHDWLGLSLV
jgi:ABC-type multidrug transport system fused ATPase/permease subunit